MKRIAYILSVALVAIALVLCMLLGALASPKVQTAAVHLVTAELSRALGSEAEVGTIAYHFPARLSIGGVYIADPAGDTLLYVGDMYAHMRPLHLLDGKIHFSTITVSTVRAYAHPLPSGEYNYQFLANLIKEDTTKQEAVFLPHIELDKVEFQDFLIRYDEHEAYMPNADIRVKHFSMDSINAEILTLSGQYNNGSAKPFRLEDLRAQLILNDTTIAAPTLYVRLPNSTLDASGVRVTYPASDTIYIRESASDIKARLQINQADICPADLGLFVPSIKTLDGKVSFTGTIEGSLDSLSATNLAVYYKGYRLVRGDISTVGLPDIFHTYMTAHCQDISLSASIVQDFISDLQNRPYVLPEQLRHLGNTHYRGTVKGHLTNLNLQGAFQTALGTITTQGHMVSDTTFSNMQFDGRVATKHFHLTDLLPSSGLGDISFDITTQGKVREGGFPTGDIHAHISELDFRDYRYQDICLHGKYSRTSYDGVLTIDDENLALNFNGVCDRTHGERYDFDLRLDRLATKPLHLTEQDLSLSLNSHVNLSGFDPDRVSGYLLIDSLQFRNVSDSIMMRRLELIAECDTTSSVPECNKSLLINSDYLTARINGTYAYTRLGNSMQKWALRLLPSLFSEQQAQHINALPASNKMQFYVYGRDIKLLQRIIGLPWRLSNYPVIRGSINDNTPELAFQICMDDVHSRTQKLLEPTFSLFANNKTAHADFSLIIPEDTIIVNKKASIDPQPLYLQRTNLRLHALAASDSVSVRIDASTPQAGEGQSKGQVSLLGKVARYAGQPLLTLITRPSQMTLRGLTYELGKGDVTYSFAENKLVVNNFRIESEEQLIAADGVASTLTSDSLILQLRHIPADPIMPLILSEQVLTVQGDVSGRIGLYSLFSSPMFTVNAMVKDVGLNNCRFGDVQANVSINEEHSQILIDGMIFDHLDDTIADPKLVANVTGHVEPGEHAWFIDIQPDSIPLGFINHWTDAFISDISGGATGSVQVFGRYASVWVTAKVKAQDVGITIPFTGCRYFVTDSVFMDSTSISFPNLTIHDIEGNRIYFNGKLTHRNFAGFTLDLEAQPVHAMALNLPDKKGELLSGRVYADGNVYIYGPDKDIHLDVDGATFGKSRLRFSIDGASSAHDNSFITFVDHTDTTVLFNTRVDDREFVDPDQDSEKEWVPDSKFTLNIGVDVNPQLLFQLMLNENTGDMIQARGEGGIRFTMDPNEDYSLIGTYTLQSGSLGFTVGNIVRRDFAIAEGSQIQFAGDPENPILDVTAKYRVTASLRDLFGDDISSLITSRTSVPVNCCVHLTGPFSDPTMQFSIELPLSEEAIRNQVLSVINTDEMLMRQVVYLLVFGRFFTPEYLQNTSATGVNEVYSILSSTITGQINAWLGKLTNVFSMGVNIRTEGEGASASQEYEAQFQLQPVDRLIINGNVGYRYNDISNRPFFGDVDVEYMLTPNGKFRIKGYTHTVDKYSLRQASTIQGVGFVFRHDFNWPSRKKKDKTSNQ